MSLRHKDIPTHPGMTASEWSVEWWKVRHAKGYFPGMEWHKDWKVCPYPPPHVLELLKPDATDIVLEIGCGYGEWMVPLAPHVAEVHGIDIHPTLEQKANEIFGQRGLGSVCEFKLCDGVSIPYPDGEFDQIYSISVFQHIPRATVRRYFEETKRVLKQGGRFLFHFRLDNGQGPYSKDITVDHAGDFSTGWTLEQVQIECGRVGLELVHHLEEEHSLFVLGVNP